MEWKYSSTLSLTSALVCGGWTTPRPGRFTPGKCTIPIAQEAGWAPGPVWKGAENLAPIGIRSPDRPARSESLYRLNYPGPTLYLLSYPGPTLYVLSYPGPTLYLLSYPGPTLYLLSYPSPTLYLLSYPGPTLYLLSYPGPTLYLLSYPGPQAIRYSVTFHKFD